MGDSEFVYNQSVDKQRVVIIGGQSKMITAMIIYVLRYYLREFDYVAQVPLNGATSRVAATDSPLIIIQEKEKPSADILGYHHHIGVISDIEYPDEAFANQFADATPKGGFLIYSETEPAQTVGKKERPDTTAVAYKSNLHITENGKVSLISSHQERYPIRLTGELDLRNISAAKETLKKIGITSEQFYVAISGFEG